MGFIHQAIRRSITSALLLLLRVYRYFISPFLGNHCRFYPSCSKYAQQALAEYHLMRALWFILRRILRCHPLHPGGYDPLPLAAPLPGSHTTSHRVKSANISTLLKTISHGREPMDKAMGDYQGGETQFSPLGKPVDICHGRSLNSSTHTD